MIQELYKPLVIYGVLGCWLLGLLIYRFFNSRNLRINHYVTHLLILLGIVLFMAQVAYIWVSIERAPFKTLGESRLWYSLFLSILGYIMFLRLKEFWILLYSLIMASVFMIVNIIKPETFDQTLGPSLQSPWFIPHVAIYMLAYALLGLTCLRSIYVLIKKLPYSDVDKLIESTVVWGFALLTLGISFGAIWAKQAWGHYWTWDAKETWALVTWLAYAMYFHMRVYFQAFPKFKPLFLTFSFILLLLCWLGMQWMPAAVNSVHNYR